MKLTRLVGVAVILGSVGAGALVAQTSPGSQPAEFPPSSYAGKQYVDSKGCVFIRAGIDGTVSWIPRVGRDRKGICGFKPTFAGQVTELETAPVAQEETVETAAAAADVTPAPRPAPKPRVVRQTAPKKARPKPVEIVAAPVVPLPPLAPGKGGPCAGASELSQRYINDGSRYPVRCGPQSLTVARAGEAPRAAGRIGKNYRSKPITVAPNARIVPRHVAINRANTQNVIVPEGYQSVWEDDRLNPYRAEQTLAGHKSMQLVWTSTVPRRLINQADKRDVTASVALVYPYTDVETQLRDLGIVTIEQRDGQTVKRIVRNPGSTAPVYSSRSAPKAAVAEPVTRPQAQPKAKTLGRGYVDVATYTDADQAQRVAKRVRRMGMPVRIGRFERGAQTYRIVIAGPFASDNVTQKAMRHLKGAGFGGAKQRR